MVHDPYAGETVAQSSELLRLTLSLLSRYRLPPSPIHYRVGYEYVSGRNQTLVEAFDQLAASPAGVTAPALLELYGCHIDQDEAAFNRSREELRKLVLQIRAELTQSGGSLAGYAQSLNQFAALLDTATSPQQMATEIGKVLDETRSVEDSQLHLQAQMQVVVAQVDALRQELELVRQEALSDALTGLANRKAFDSALDSCVREARDSRTPLALLMADIDRFKAFNDAHGHLVGDKVLRFVASALRRVIKGKDFAARFGGEEFAVILPQTTMSGAEAVAEHIRGAISAGKLVDTRSSVGYGVVTVSIGIAQFGIHDTTHTLLQRADQALYLAKSRGRNRSEKVL